MTKIRLLPPEIYSKIAAGEVIDGPYSVVRELTDNSIDAESRSIKITTKSGGKELIIVHDDGVGMSWEDAKLALKRHATSKISNVDDLKHIRTMGFRGEALSSICTVSEIELITKEKDNDVGLKLICEYEKISKVEPVPFTEGTKVIVKNLFNNMPARRKFLRSNRSENSRIKDTIVKKALCFNKIAFKYMSEDRIIFSLPSVQSKRERISSLFGNDIGKHLIELNYREERFRIEGFITDRDYTLLNRNGQYLFINQRPIYNRSFQFIINEAAKRFVSLGKYVYAFIYVIISPELIDVNVHPAKLEVKVKIEKDVSSALYRIIQSAYQNRIFVPRNAIDHDKERIDEQVLKNEKDYMIGQLNLSSKMKNNDLYLVKDKESIEYNWMKTGQKEKNESFEIKNVDLIGEELPIESFDIYNMHLRYIGSIFNGFLIFEEDESIFLIDQHAAHERVLYEQFMEKYSKFNISTTLLIPINLTPPPGKYDEIIENIEDFNRAGIEIEPFGDGSFNIVSIPAFLPEDKETKIILEFFNEYFEKQAFPESGSIKDRFLKYASCKAAIKEGDKIGDEEAFHLLKRLFKCKIPYICPHGRPTVLRIRKDYVEKIFKRR